MISEKDEEEEDFCGIDVEMESSHHRNGLSEAGTIGVAISMMCLGVIVIVIIVVLCLWRRYVRKGLRERERETERERV